MRTFWHHFSIEDIYEGENTRRLTTLSLRRLAKEIRKREFLNSSGLILFICV